MCSLCSLRLNIRFLPPLRFLAFSAVKYSLFRFLSLRLNNPFTQKGDDMNDIKTLTDQVRQTAYDIHVYHGHGHLEKVYENALVNRLRKAGLDVKQQHPIQVYDKDGTMIGDYLA